MEQDTPYRAMYTYTWDLAEQDLSGFAEEMQGIGVNTVAVAASYHAGKFIRPKGKSGKVFIALDNVIRACLPQMFRGVFRIDEVAAYCFKFSRDAELEIDPGITESLIDKMETSLKQRRRAEARGGAWRRSDQPRLRPGQR